MSSGYIKEEVVFIFDPKDYTPVWKDIPGFSNYQVSNLGVIRRKTKTGYTHGKLYAVKTSVGTYLRVSAVSDDYRVRSKEIHHLVCLAFHGGPPQDGKVYEVNHKDGNKHNNLPDNVEWMTRGENLIHAYKNGLRTDSQAVRMYDEKEGVTHDIYSISELGRQLGVSKSEAWTIISNHRETAYQGRYTFEILKGKRRSTKHTHIRQVKAYDYKNNKLITADHLGELEIYTGVKRGTILWHLKKNSLALVKGHVFMYIGDKRDFPDYTPAEVDESIAVAEARKPQAKKNLGGVYLRDYVNARTLEFQTVKDVAAYLGYANSGTVRHYLRKPEITPFKGHALKYKDDPRPFPELTEFELNALLRTARSTGETVFLTDLDLNTTSVHPSLSAAAGQIGISLNKLAEYVRNHPGKVLDKRYLIGKMPHS